MRKNLRSPTPPEGFRYQADVLPLNEERDLVEQIRELPLKEFEFHGYVGKRRVISYGWHYDFGERTLQQTSKSPRFSTRCANARLPSRICRRKTCLTRSSPSTARAPQSAGIGTKASSAT